jgi:hypothetical protein
MGYDAVIEYVGHQERIHAGCVTRSQAESIRARPASSKTAALYDCLDHETPLEEVEGIAI